MRIHTIQTGTVAVKQRQVRGAGHGIQRRVNIVLDRAWTEPLPTYVWVIEHPEGIIVVDTRETAVPRNQGISLVASLLPVGCARVGASGRRSRAIVARTGHPSVGGALGRPDTHAQRPFWGTGSFSQGGHPRLAH
jgi:hypothetical protein